MKCPESYIIPAAEGEFEKTVYFDENSVQMVIQDISNISEVTFDPSEAQLTLGSYVTVDVTATDSVSNRNKCKFQVSFQGILFLYKLSTPNMHCLFFLNSLIIANTI